MAAPSHASWPPSFPPRLSGEFLQDGVGREPWRPQGIPGSGMPFAIRSPSLWGPVSQSRKLAFEALQSLWSVSIHQNQPPPATLNPFQAPHLQPPHPPMCSPPLPLLLLSSSDPPLEIRCPLSLKVIPISPLICVSSYAFQKIELGGKKSGTERA